MTKTEESIFRGFLFGVYDIAFWSEGSDSDWHECITRAMFGGTAKGIEPKIIRVLNDEAYYNAPSKSGTWIEFEPGYRYAIKEGDSLDCLLAIAERLRQQAARDPEFKTVLEEFAQSL